MMRRRKKSVSPPDDGDTPKDEKASGGLPTPKPQGEPAMIPEDKLKGMEEIVKAFSNGNGGVKGFSMNELLKMDDSSKTLPDILGVPIGAQEGDMYRILERCRLTKHEKQVFVNAIHLAEHGFGYSYKGINLDFPIPFYGEYIVKHLRGSVSVDGESLATFERTVSTWVAKLYATQQQQQVQSQRGIIQ